MFAARASSTAPSTSQALCSTKFNISPTRPTRSSVLAVDEALDILNQMRSELPLIVRSLDSRISSQGHEEVDAKLVRLAKVLDGAIVTNDFNLNKVAELQGVQVLNINELANALKPVVLPGEEMRVTRDQRG